MRKKVVVSIVVVLLTGMTVGTHFRDALERNGVEIKI